MTRQQQRRAYALEMDNLSEEREIVDGMIYARRLSCMASLSKSLPERQQAAEAFVRQRYSEEIAWLKEPRRVASAKDIAMASLCLPITLILKAVKR